MSEIDPRRLELVRRAWQADAADDAETEAAVRRLSRRLEARRKPRDPARRVLSLGIALLAFGATVAFAASGGRLPGLGGAGASEPRPATAPPLLERLPAPEPPPSRVAPRSAPAPEPESEAPAPAPRPAAAPRSGAAPRAPAPSAVRSAGEAPAPDPTPASGAVAESAAPASASWTEVSEALAARDDGRARQALEALGRDADPTTRAKARLGLAQLAASRGDCAHARSLAQEVAASPDADARTSARARALAARCARQGSRRNE